MPDSTGQEPITWPDPPVKEKAYWGLAVVVSLVLAGVVMLITSFAGWHWAYVLHFGYLWPSIKGNGPEALAQTVVYFAIAAIFVPVVRKFIAREFSKVHHSIHVHGTEITAHLHHIAKESGLDPFEHSDEYKDHIANHLTPGAKGE